MFRQGDVMPKAQPGEDHFRFGQFDLASRTGELRNDGIRIKISGQPVEVLKLLLERPGELVSRDEIRERLWPGDTFVDFDHSLNTAIKRLRNALNDDSEHPHFIETLPRKGYRFIGTLEQPALPPALILVEPSSQPSPPPPVQLSRLKVLLLAAMVAVTLLAFIPLLRTNRSTPTTKARLVQLTALEEQEISPTFNPDGSQVAFGWNGENNGRGYDLYLKVIGTEQPVRLTNQPARYLSTAWSPDGRWIAFVRFTEQESGIFVIPSLPGGQERKLLSINPFFYPSRLIDWSPDGKQLAFVNNPAAAAATDVLSLSLLNLDTLEKKDVKSDCPRIMAPAFSPQGDFLAFSCIDQYGSDSLRLWHIADERSTTLLTSQGDLDGLGWSSDSKRIVFASSGIIKILSLDDPTHLRDLGLGHDASTVVSTRHQNLLAYAQQTQNVNIWRVDLEAKSPVAHSLIASTVEQGDPAISPDGSHIAFESTRSGTNEVWMSDSNGANPVQLSNFGVALTGTPHWSPDGHQIVFDSQVGGQQNIYVIDASGGVARKFETGTHDNSLASWSHDGNSIYFTTGMAGANPYIWAVNIAAPVARQITTENAAYPMESPDGRFVYFVRSTGGKNMLWRVHPNGSGEESVAGMPQLRTPNEWFPTSSGIYFIFAVDPKYQIRYFDLATRKVRTVITLPRDPRPWIGGLSVSSDEKWLLYSQIDKTASDLMMIENW